jgi:hypothetical protein
VRDLEFYMLLEMMKDYHLFREVPDAESKRR